MKFHLKKRTIYGKKLSNNKFKIDKSLPIVVVKNLYFKYPSSNKAILNNISFTIEKNDFFTILGPSGSGKTTLLRLISGFLPCEKNKIYYYNKDLYNISSNKRNIRTIFQNLSLFPHMNVEENIAYTLKIKHYKRQYISEQVKEYLNLVHLNNYEKKKVNSLSGGQRQRVAIARALISKPEIILLDEPFSSLDVKIKEKLYYHIKDIQKKTGVTFVLITHDQEEALFLSDNLIVLMDGEIKQRGGPINIYNEPINKSVGKFIGDSIIIDNAIFIEDKKVKWDNTIFNCIDVGFQRNQNVDVIIRPEDIYVSNKKYGLINGIVKSVYFKGVHWNIFVESKHRIYRLHTTDYYKIGSKIYLSWDPDDLHIMSKEKKKKND